MLQGDIDLWKLQDTLNSSISASPQFGYFLLDETGAILVDLSGSAHHHVARAALEPIHEFLATRSESGLPVYGASLFRPGERSVFAARRVRIQEQAGYLLLAANQPNWRDLSGALATRHHPHP